MSQVILIDENNKEIGFEDKLVAHRLGKLHRAFSIFIFNDKNEILIQKRAIDKYHSSGLWSNACCSHPLPYLALENEIHSRLIYENGFDCDLKELFSFKYKCKFPNNLFENELDFVYIGKYNGNIILNKEEASDYKWVSFDKLQIEILKTPKLFTYWFKLILKDYSHLLKFP